MANKIGFTMAALARIKPPADGRQYFYDLKTSGLAFCITATGFRAFYWLKKIAGRTERFRLGGFPAITVETARELAASHNADVAKGTNPADAKRKRRGELTMGELFDLYLEFKREHKKASSLATDEATWARYMLGWNGRKLSSVANNDIRALHATVGKVNGKYAANRLVALLSTMFNLATDHGEWKQVNPCRGVKMFAEKSRDRFLQPEELPRFLKALDGIANQPAADAFRLMLLTGARKGNILSMAWKDIDLPGATWRIPDTKANEPQRVHVTAEAVAILAKRKTTTGESPFVFPARTAGAKAGHLQDVTTPWDLVCEAAELPGLRMHDLRRSLGSWMVSGGASLPIIGKALGHHDQQTTTIYARLNIDPVRAAVDSAVAAMLAAAQPDKNQAAAADDEAPLGVG